MKLKCKSKTKIKAEVHNIGCVCQHVIFDQRKHHKIKFGILNKYNNIQGDLHVTESNHKIKFGTLINRAFLY